MPLSKVTDMSFQRSFGGRILGYGELIVESAGQNQALDRVPYIPYPEQLYLLVCGILFPAGAEEPSDALLARRVFLPRGCCAVGRHHAARRHEPVPPRDPVRPDGPCAPARFWGDLSGPSFPS